MAIAPADRAQMHLGLHFALSDSHDEVAHYGYGRHMVDLRDGNASLVASMESFFREAKESVGN